MAVTFPTLDRQSVKKIARQLAPGYILYNPSPRWLRLEYNGNFYHFPPDLGGELVDHPVLRDAQGEPVKVKADGLYSVKDRYGIIYDMKNPTGGRFGFNLPILDGDGKIEEETADKVVSFFTSKYGEGAENPSMAIGITLLTGNESVDEQIKPLARKLWVKSQLAWAQKERSDRQNFLTEWRQKNPGRTDFPPMNVRQIEAEEILLQSEVQLSASKYAYVCSEGDYETNDLKKFQDHTRVRHPDFALETKSTEVTKVVPVPEVAKKRGRPRKVVLNVAQDVTEQVG